jgi:hypothetical protein
MTQPIRQGDVILIPIVQAAEQVAERSGLKSVLSHLTLAEGEVTGHRHRISAGNAQLYEQLYEQSNGSLQEPLQAPLQAPLQESDRTLYLQVLSDTATLTHEEHHPIQIPQGTWMVRIQREYEPEGWRQIVD